MPRYLTVLSILVQELHGPQVARYEIQFTDIFDQIVAFAAGKPINVVNPEVLTGTTQSD